MASIVSFTFREAVVDVEYEGEDFILFAKQGEDLMKLFDRSGAQCSKKTNNRQNLE